MRVLIHVTHLLGTGHLRRAVTLAKGFSAAGHQAVVMSGGRPVAGLDLGGVELEQLPPVCSDGVNFTRLLDEQMQPVDAAYLSARTEQAYGLVKSFHPDVLITELFPFGRRILADEFLAVIETAKAQDALILSSIRDILAPPSKPAKAEQAEARIVHFYDGVLVHSVGDLIPLGKSWPVSKSLEPRLHYTGFVAPELPPKGPAVGTDEILVATGGGAVGDDLFGAAMQAASESPYTWRILVGGTAPEVRITALRDRFGPTPAILEPARPDYRQMLMHARASVSMCGYNTAMDVLQTGVPAVFVPFDAGGEVEQSLRAEALSDQPGITVLRSEAVTPEALLEAVTTTLSHPQRAPSGQFDGVARSVQIVQELLEQRGK